MFEKMIKALKGIIFSKVYWDIDRISSVKYTVRFFGRKKKIDVRNVFLVFVIATAWRAEIFLSGSINY